MNRSHSSVIPAEGIVEKRTQSGGVGRLCLTVPSSTVVRYRAGTPNTTFMMNPPASKYDKKPLQQLQMPIYDPDSRSPVARPKLHEVVLSGGGFASETGMSV
jgi:hypothetical protein